MTTISLDIQGMSCNHCVMRVQKALAAVPGVENAQVTLQPARARVWRSTRPPRRRRC